jgi:uncharacterized protein
LGFYVNRNFEVRTVVLPKNPARAGHLTGSDGGLIMSEQYMPSEVTSEDKLWAALAYVFSPLVPIIILLLEDKKNRPFIRAHNMQALVWGVAFYIIVTITSTFLIGLCIWPLGFIAQLYWAYKAYQGEMVEIPVISNLVRNQGWS